MRTGPGFDEQSVPALVNQPHAANPARRTFTLADVAEALYRPGTAAIAQGVLVAPRRPGGQPARHARPDGSAQQHLDETRAPRPAPDHHDRGGGISPGPGLTGIRAPTMDESAAAGSHADEQPSDAPDPPGQPGRQARGHQLIRTGPDARTGIYGSEGWGFESLRARSCFPRQGALVIPRPGRDPLYIHDGPMSVYNSVVYRHGESL
jgi:hypothetical protein